LRPEGETDTYKVQSTPAKRGWCLAILEVAL
jgi:hypothetical protein